MTIPSFWCRIWTAGPLWVLVASFSDSDGSLFDSFPTRPAPGSSTWPTRPLFDLHSSPGTATARWLSWIARRSPEKFKIMIKSQTREDWSLEASLPWQMCPALFEDSRSPSPSRWCFDSKASKSFPPPFGWQNPYKDWSLFEASYFKKFLPVVSLTLRCGVGCARSWSRVPSSLARSSFSVRPTELTSFSWASCLTFWTWCFCFWIWWRLWGPFLGFPSCKASIFN